jgi:thiamine biosynthesis protein ThiI
MEKALLLLSGGIDSPVAGAVAKEKFSLEAIHFSQAPFTDDTPEKKSIALAKKVGLREIIIVSAGKEFQAIAEKSAREYYFVLIKRFMVKVAEKVAEQRGAKFLITGESIGQVSSQTVSNLNSINNAAKIEILRPLLFFNKQEIIDKSIALGFFETSKGPELCDALASGKPKTKTALWDIEREEKKCGMNELVGEALGKITIKKI